MRPHRTERWVNEAAKKLGVTLSRHARGEAAGPCPKCGGKDRFIAFMKGNFWCRRCEHKGWWVENPDEGRKQLANEKIRQEQEQAALRQTMAGCQDWIDYHASALRSTEAQHIWERHGIRGEEISKWGLGYCPSCPLAPDYQSLSIPCFQGGVLLDIRHRLVSAPSEMGKYRPHLPGLRPPVFNLDATGLSQDIIVVEGEKKVIVLDRFGFHGAVGLPGINFARYLLATLPGRMGGDQSAVVMLDPHTNRRGERLARALVDVGVKTLVADSYMKPDDLLLTHGVGVVKEIIKQARQV